MHFKCTECGARSKIYSRKEVSPQLTTLYYACTRAEECGHRFAVDLSFSHTIAPAADKFRSMMLDFIRQLPDHERASLLSSR